MYNRYASQPQPPYPYFQGMSPPITEDGRAFQTSSNTGYSQQPRSPQSLSGSRTFRAPHHPPTPFSLKFPGCGCPQYVLPQTPVATGLPCTPPSPAYGITPYQASMVDPRAGVQQDSSNFGRPDLIPGGAPPPPPSSPSYQQTFPDADPSGPRSRRKSFRQFAKGLMSPQRIKFDAEEFQAGPPALSSRGQPPADWPGRDSVPGSAQYPNFGSNLGGRVLGEPKIPMAQEDYNRAAPQTNAEPAVGGYSSGVEAYYYYNDY
ncbi:hypothetical protein FRC01_001415 [Tulasnella sp. 417]|nr:hypothetical protein FRC01_001415 [Tulasnella sp. 417]